MSINYTQGDRRPFIRYILKRGETVLPLDAATGVSLKLWRAEHEAYESSLLSGACTLTTDGTDGDVTYALQDGDLATAGRMSLAFLVDWGGGEVETIPDEGYISVVVHPAT